MALRHWILAFIDAWGNKIEPEDGTVQVSIELEASLLPEEASQDTLAIQHLDETNEQLEVQTVADAANGTVAVEAGTVKADFSGGKLFNLYGYMGIQLP